jgi:type II pantothenate kinase
MISIGIDAGGTLIKIAYMKNDSLEFKKIPISQLKYVALWINGFDKVKICITGGRAALLKTYMNQNAAEIVEFEATSNGVRYLLSKKIFHWKRPS